MAQNDATQVALIEALRQIQHTQSQLVSVVESLSDRVGSIETAAGSPILAAVASGIHVEEEPSGKPKPDVLSNLSTSVPTIVPVDNGTVQSASLVSPTNRSSFTSRIVLT